MPASGSPITSRQHPLVKLCRTLHEAKGRREHGLFLIEGKNAVEAALRGRWPLREVLALESETQLSTQAETLGLPVRRLSGEAMEAATEAQTKLPIVALGQLPTTQHGFSLEGLLVVVDGVSDPGNVGTILRAADAAGAEKVILTSGSADPWSPKVVRSAAGSLFSLPPLHLPDRSPQAIVELLSAEDIPLVTAEAHGGQSCYEFAWPQRCALILGHETRGISEEFAQNATIEATIPMFGGAESLNVAMAGTLLCYAWRQSVQTQRARHS